MDVSLRYGMCSASGYVRENNEDSAFAGPRLLAVADGMGGHEAGEVASALVIAELAPLNDRDPTDDPFGELRQATHLANAGLARYIANHPEAEGMGTTLTAILFDVDTLGVVHVGDSRAYLLRDGSLRQITKDETYVQSLVDQGRLTSEEARRHPQRSLVLRAMTGQELDPFLEKREARPGDRYLICSDGLSDYVTTRVLAEGLHIDNPQECARTLVQLAMRADSQDNITCIVADVVNGDSGYDIPFVVGAVGHENSLIEP